MVNFSKFLTEMIGTASIAIIYLILGELEIGMFLGYWIVTIFGSQISGSHFNPVITLAAMFRSGDSCLESKLLGIIYIYGQFVGSIIAGFLGIVLLEPKNKNQNYKCSIEPQFEKESVVLISEMVGTAVFVSNFLIHTDKSTRYSNDKSVNSLIIASAYIGARLMCGGYFLTGIPQIERYSFYDEDGTL